jgi:hypothetical protein
MSKRKCSSKQNIPFLQLPFDLVRFITSFLPITEEFKGCEHIQIVLVSRRHRERYGKILAYAKTIVEFLRVLYNNEEVRIFSMLKNNLDPLQRSIIADRFFAEIMDVIVVHAEEEKVNLRLVFEENISTMRLVVPYLNIDKAIRLSVNALYNITIISSNTTDKGWEVIWWTWFMEIYRVKYHGINTHQIISHMAEPSILKNLAMAAISSSSTQHTFYLCIALLLTRAHSKNESSTTQLLGDFLPILSRFSKLMKMDSVWMDCDYIRTIITMIIGTFNGRDQYSYEIHQLLIKFLELALTCLSRETLATLFLGKKRKPTMILSIGSSWYRLEFTKNKVADANLKWLVEDVLEKVVSQVPLVI